MKRKKNAVETKSKGSPFFAQVYACVREIPRGKVLTYGAIAKTLGTADARRVGWALHANTDEKTPCHRVVNKIGRLADNFAFDGWREQKRRLAAEGVAFLDETHVDLEKHLWLASFDKNSPRKLT